MLTKRYNYDDVIELLGQLNDHTDAAHVYFAQAFYDLAFNDGGDDDWPSHLHPYTLALMLPEQAIEEYNESDPDDHPEIFFRWYIQTRIALYAALTPNKVTLALKS